MPKLHQRLAYYDQRATMPGIFGTDAAAVYVHTGVYRTSVCIEWPIAHRSAYGLILYVFQQQINRASASIRLLTIGG